jgi:hypothetical protein
MKTIILFIVLFIYTTGWAQLPYTFTQTAHIYNGGEAWDLAVSTDQTVFVANNDIGLWAYSYADTSFTNTAHINDGGPGYGVAVGYDGTVFLANGSDGLRAYSYGDTSFINTAQIFGGIESGMAWGVTVGTDRTVFLSQPAHLPPGGGENIGLFALSHVDTSFSVLDHITFGSYWLTGVTVDSNGTVFLASSNDGLRAYTFDGASFTNTAHINNGGSAVHAAVGADGTIFLANGSDGLRAYSYGDTSFINIAHIDDGGYAYGVAVGPNGTIFLASLDDGLRAYSFDGASFTNTAHIDSGGNARGVAVGSDGTVFLVDTNTGLYAYTYSGYTAIENQPLKALVGYTLYQNYPNPFNPATTIEFTLSQTGFVSLKVFNILGEEVTTLVSKRLTAGSYKYDWDASSLASGVYLYRIQAGEFGEVKKMVLMR